MVSTEEIEAVAEYMARIQPVVKLLSKRENQAAPQAIVALVHHIGVLARNCAETMHQQGIHENAREMNDLGPELARMISMIDSPTISLYQFNSLKQRVDEAVESLAGSMPQQHAA